MANYNKIGEIKVSQRTATGTDRNASIKVYVVKNVEAKYGDIRLMDIEDALSFVAYRSVIVGYYEVFYPLIMWGSTDEILSDMYRLVLKDMENRGLITYNDHGIAFWVEKGQGDK